MKRKHFRIFILITIVCILFTGYLKGCNSTEPYPIPVTTRDSATFNVNLNDSLITVAAGPHYKKTKFHDIFFGSHYRDLWALPVKMNVFDIGKEMGGLKILKKGGHFQTLSLRLENKEGKKYVLRTIDKDQSMALFPPWRTKMLIYIMRDQTSAINPYAALIIPPLSLAAGVPSTHPELFFIPYDKRLEEHAKLLEGRVAILEEFPDESWADSEGFKSKNIINTSELLSKRFRSHDVIINERTFARARLFDLFIGDWDRHAEQWRWMEQTNGNKKIYSPFPRDRDMAFYKIDSGIFPAIVLKFNNKFQSFNSEYKDIKGLVKNATYIDGLILNSLSEEDFTSIADSLQKKLTDSVIEEAIKSWPEDVYKMIGAETIKNLKSRRDKLGLAAKEFYRIIYEEVNLAGTDLMEEFIVNRINDNETSVLIKDETGNIIYERIFNNKITKEINLYGLNGEDKFTVSGKTDEGICINIYGGEGHDVINDLSSVKGYFKKTKIFDSKGDNEIVSSEETEDNTTDDPSVLYFDKSGARRKW